MSKIFPNPDYNEVYFDILTHNRQREWDTLNVELAANSFHANRRELEQISEKANIRPSFFHDTDRIIHCQAYSRYIDKTQVFFQSQNDHITRRVLHVQMVSKIGRTLARFFRVNEDLVEAIALAHDLGHTPFGHAGESILAEILEEKGAGSFVHNAHSVRVLDKLENGGKGLNLTIHVLDGVLGHNGEVLDKNMSSNLSNLRWDVLDKNVKRCLTEPRANKVDTEIYPSTFEGCLVRISDVFSYIGRDIEDAITLKIIKREQLPQDAVEILGGTNREIINNLAMDVTHNSHGKNEIGFSPEAFGAMETLRNFNYKYIYKAEVVLEQIEKFHKLVRELFECYLNDLESGKENTDLYIHFLSQMNDKYRTSTPPARIIADFIAGMTDRFLLDQYTARFLPERIGHRGV